MLSRFEKDQQDLEEVERDMRLLADRIDYAPYRANPNKAEEDLERARKEGINKLIELRGKMEKIQNSSQAFMKRAEYGEISEWEAPAEMEKMEKLTTEGEKLGSDEKRIGNEVYKIKKHLDEINSAHYIEYKELFKRRLQLRQNLGYTPSDFYAQPHVEYIAPPKMDFAANMRTLLQTQPAWYQEFVKQYGFRMLLSDDPSTVKFVHQSPDNGTAAIELNKNKVIYDGKITPENMNKIVYVMVALLIKSLEDSLKNGRAVVCHTHEMSTEVTAYFEKLLARTIVRNYPANTEHTINGKLITEVDQKYRQLSNPTQPETENDSTDAEQADDHRQRMRGP